MITMDAQLHSAMMATPLERVMRSEIALPLRHMMRIYTVGGLLRAWDDASAQRQIERLFDSPQQALHAVAICAAMVGQTTAAFPLPASAWWRDDGQHAN